LKIKARSNAWYWNK